MVFSQELNEGQVYLLWGDAAVDEEKKIKERLALPDVSVNHALEFLLHDLAALREAVAGEVDEIPLLVDEEMVDEDGLSRRERSLGEACAASEHVDETALSHVTAPDKGKLRFAVCWTLCNVAAACNEICCLDGNHVNIFVPAV